MNKISYVDFKKKKIVDEGFSVDKNNDLNVIFQSDLASDRELLRSKLYDLPPCPNCPTNEEAKLRVSYEKSSLYIDFKKKRKVPEFKVNKDRDKNIILSNWEKKLEEFEKRKKYAESPGPDCPSDEELRAFAYYTGFFHRDEVGKAMAKILYHTEKCERCDAFVFKTIIDAHRKNFSHDKNNES